jgi:predicted dehydrogenase
MTFSRRRDSLRSRCLDLIDRLGGAGAWRRAARPSRPLEARTGIAFVGCGFVADFYAANLPLHPELALVGVFDRHGSRAESLAARHGARAFGSLDALLSDPAVELVVNLTNPASHFAVSQACLSAGKHVYSEKPLAMTLGEAQALVALAREAGVRLAGAPCGLLGESLQALRRLVTEGDIGPVRVVYAELDDGPIHRMRPETWESPDGAAWPWRDEFETGCVLEHAGYHLSWMAALFGAARCVTATSACLVPEKHPDLQAAACGPDFAVACITFESGVVARLTCSTLAPHDHSVRIIGERGMLQLDEIWHFGAPVRVSRFDELWLRADSYAWLKRRAAARAFFGLDGRLSPLSPAAGWRRRIRRHEMDYLIGVTDLAASLPASEPPQLSAELALHVTELALAISEAGRSGASVALSTRI